MGWNTTRSLRFYSKNDDIGSINIESIIEEISNTARSLCNEIVYSKNDHENCYDELKNQWGWCGYTTRSLAQCEVMAGFIALMYNWWSLYGRLIHSQANQREAITSRSLLLSAVSWISTHQRQRTITICPVHAYSEQVIKRVNKVSAWLKQIAWKVLLV